MEAAARFILSSDTSISTVFVGSCPAASDPPLFPSMRAVFSLGSVPLWMRSMLVVGDSTCLLSVTLDFSVNPIMVSLAPKSPNCGVKAIGVAILNPASTRSSSTLRAVFSKFL